MYKLNGIELPQQAKEFTTKEFIEFSNISTDLNDSATAMQANQTLLNWIVWANKRGAEIDENQSISAVKAIVEDFYKGVKKTKLIKKIKFENEILEINTLTAKKFKEFLKVKEQLKKGRKDDRLIVIAVLTQEGEANQINFIKSTEKIRADFAISCWVYFSEEIKAFI